MAPFNKEIPVAQPVSYDMSVPQFAGDTSRGTMIKGLTDAFKNLVLGADTLIKEKIDTDLTKSYDQAQSDFGVPQMADALDARTHGLVTGDNMLDQVLPGGRPATSPGGGTVQTPQQPGAPLSLAPPGGPQGAGVDVVPSGAPMPSGVASATQQMQTLKSAYQMGGIPEAYYWARMNSLLRQVRANYPGYRDYVDAKFSQLLGEPTANHVRQQLIDQLGKESPEQKQYRDLVERAAFGGVLPKDFNDRKASGNPYTYDELISKVGARERDTRDMKDRQAEIAALKSNNELTTDKALIAYKADTQQIVRTALTDMSESAGQAWSNLQHNLPKWNEEVSSGQMLTPDEQKQARLWLNQVRAGLEQKLAGLATQQLGSGNDPKNRYGAILKPEDIAAANKQAMAAVSVLETSILGKDGQGVGLVTAVKTWLDANKDASQRAIIQNVPQIQTWQALSNLVGGQMAALLIAMNPKLQDAVVESFIQADWGKAWMNGDQGASILEDMKKAHTALPSETQSKQYNKAAMDTWNRASQSIVSGKLTGDLARKGVAYVYGPKNLGVMSSMDPAVRRRYFLEMAGPRSTAALLKLKKDGDVQSWNTYKTWVLNGFQALARQDINTLRGFNTSLTGYKITWDEKQNRFVADKVGQPERGGQFFGAPAAVEATDSIHRLNELIGIMSPIIQAEGMNPGQELRRWFNAMGLQSQAGPGMTSAAHQLASALNEGAPPETPGSQSPFDLGARQPAATPVNLAGAEKIAGASKRMQNMASLTDFKTYHPEEQHAMLERAIQPELFPQYGADPHRDKNLFSSGRAARLGIQGGISQNLTSFTVNNQPVMVNKLAAPHFEGFIRALEAEGYKIRTISGFSPRMKRGGTTPSEHAYGNAIDINADTNQFHGNKTDLPKNVAILARRYGLIWGGEWRGTSRDPMHFEWSGQLGTADLPPPIKVAGNGPLQLPDQEQPLGPRDQNHLGQAADALDLTAPELMLYEQHLENLRGNGKVMNKDGSISTIKNITAGIDGMTYVIPTVWDGAVHSAKEAVAHAREVGLRKFPAYNTPQEAEKRYNAMHKYMDMDVRDYLKKHKNG